MELLQNEALSESIICDNISKNDFGHLTFANFDVAELAPYAVEADAYLTSKVHMLWETLMGLYRTDPSRCKLRVIDPLKN